MDAAERHVLDAVPVPLGVWEAQGRSLTLRWANDQAGRSPLPTDVDPLVDACLDQVPASVELRGEATFWRAQVMPLGGTQVLIAFYDITVRKAHEQSLQASEQLNREILS